MCLPGSERFTEVTSVGQLLVQLSSRGKFQNNVDSILVPKVTIHAKDVLLPGWRWEKGKLVSKWCADTHLAEDWYLKCD